ncbi:DUF1573 domain-containing protein [Aquimarina gracilis]|uniref:DUF1573 domain-containing protein n=1 Tax=Aquimarina gracilis TaxID=874422 RepID=A0ABU5ZYM5_9FLAO|nr:DUF1573 domain-containing protein [Aquimarina gracilis]MEB3346952.1 DUF1573 domain-containing protein [Aquimarina gracilis]
MKKGILILAGIFAMTFVSCKDDATKKVKEENVEIAAERDAKNTDFPVMTFAETEHDFGTINEGDVVEHKFTFTNTGKAPLVIVNAKGSCGCTVPQWTKDPVPPGGSGEMLVKFNSSGKPNQQTKQVTITTNTEAGKEIIKIRALVTPKAKPVSGTPVSE